VYFVPEKQNLSSRHCILGASGTWAFFSQNIDASDRMARKIKDEHMVLHVITRHGLKLLVLNINPAGLQITRLLDYKQGTMQRSSI